MTERDTPSIHEGNESEVFAFSKLTAEQQVTEILF